MVANLRTKLLRLVGGLLLLTGTCLFFMSGLTPPGPAGDVLRHNQEHQIDASPLFYSEVENMGELEEGLRARRAAESPDD